MQSFKFLQILLLLKHWHISNIVMLHLLEVELSESILYCNFMLLKTFISKLIIQFQSFQLNVVQVQHFPEM